MPLENTFSRVIQGLLRFGEWIVLGTPLLAAYLQFAPLEPGPLSLRVWELTAVLILTFFSWSVFQRLMIARLRGTTQQSTSKKSRFLSFFLLFMVVALLLTALSQLRSIATQELFVGVLGIIAVGAIGGGLHTRNRVVPAIFFRLLFYTLIGSLSFFVRTNLIHLWQPVVFSLALAIMVELVNMLALVRAQGSNPFITEKQWKIVARLVTLFVVAAPNVLAVLCVMVALEKKYLITLIILVQAGKPLARLAAIPFKEEVPERLLTQLRVLPIEFVAFLVVLRLL